RCAALCDSERDQLLGGTYRDALRDDPVRERLLLLRVLDAEKGASMARRQDPRSDPALYRSRKVEQPDGVRDLWTAPADPSREFLVRPPELVKQLLVCRRFLQRVEVRPVDVLQERVPEHRVVARVPYDRRDGVPAECLCGTPPAFSNHELELA